jgi:hypothetical protein
MGNTRVKYFELDDNIQQFNFGTYALLMYYAKQIDVVNSKLFFDATLTEFEYRIYYNLSIGDISDDDSTAHFDTIDLQNAIAFIENQLIPTLNGESQDLLVKYGGIDNFYNLFYADTGFLENIEIGTEAEEFYDTDPIQIVMMLNSLVVLFQSALSENTAYEVNVF